MRAPHATPEAAGRPRVPPPSRFKGGSAIGIITPYSEKLLLCDALGRGPYWGRPGGPGATCWMPPTAAAGASSHKRGGLSHSDDNGSGLGAGARRSARPASGRAPSRSRRWTPHEPALGVRLAIVPAPRPTRSDDGLCPLCPSPVPSQGCIAPAPPLPSPDLPRPFPDRRSEVAFARPRDRIESP